MDHDRAAACPDRPEREKSMNMYVLFRQSVFFDFPKRLTRCLVSKQSMLSTPVGVRTHSSIKCFPERRDPIRPPMHFCLGEECRIRSPIALSHTYGLESMQSLHWQNGGSKDLCIVAHCTFQEHEISDTGISDCIFRYLHQSLW